MTEFRPWKGDSIEEAVKNTRTTKEVDEGVEALQRVRAKMGVVLKKDQSLKVGMYTPKAVVRKEGEKWEEDGKMWEMKHGFKQSISKLQGAKRPWFCPKCGNIMNTRLDDKMWFKKGTCFGCVLSAETKLRVTGKWHEHQRRVMRANAISHLKNMIEELEGYKSTTTGKVQIHFADGRYEDWGPDMDVDKLKEEFQEAIDKLQVDLNELERLQNDSTAGTEN